MKPEPLTPPDCDLRDFTWMPLEVTRLRDSDLAVLASGDAFRAAVLLWCAAWHQVPAASLPNDDRLLANLAGYGRDMKGWAAVRDEALRGFVECSDGRLYHPVVAEKAIEADDQRKKQKERTRAAANARRNGNRDDDRHDQRDDQLKQRNGGRNDSRSVDRNEVQQTLPDSTITGKDKDNSKTDIESLERESLATREKPSASPPDALAEVPTKVLKEPKRKPTGLGSTQLPEEWIPDDELCAKVTTDFGMEHADIQSELNAFHAHHAAAGSFSANWRASFLTWCKRWKEHRDKQAPPRVQVSREAPKPPKDFTDEEWDKHAGFYARTGRWSQGLGPDPMHVGRCLCPRHVLERNDVNPETGERRIPPRKPSQPPEVRA